VIGDRRGQLDGRADRFYLLLALIALLAFVVREQFVLTAIVDAPIRGDIFEYANYAWNLVHHGVFSLQPPNPGHIPTPDAYRLPGYPLLLALGMVWFPDNLAWISFVLQVQVLLGTATVVLAGLLAREWLPSTWSISAAALIALWPHHIAATGAMLSEIVFGFALLASLFCFARGWREQGSSAWIAGAGAGLGYAWLVNPILLPFPLALAALAWRHDRGHKAALLLGVFLLPVATMLIRDARIPPGNGSQERAQINFVQGSWPDYHNAANRFRTGDPMAIWIMQQIGRETDALRDEPLVGARMIGSRIASQPRIYAGWYVSKAWLLWGWAIQVGADDIHFHQVQHSTLKRAPLKWVVATYKTINPLLTALLLVGCIILPAMGWRHRKWVPAAAVGGLGLYLTLVHVVLQAEPRYAIAYRGFEGVIAASVCALGVGRLRAAIQRQSSKSND
jgi:hypothetical protein